MTRQGAIDTLKEHLNGYVRDGDSAQFFDGGVKLDRPLALSPRDRLGILYTMGEGELPEVFRSGSLRTRFKATRWAIKVFWQPTTSAEKREQRLLEQWDVRDGITELLSGDSKLGGNVSDLKIRAVTQEPEPYGENQAEWDVLTIVFDTWDLVGEAVSA